MPLSESRLQKGLLEVLVSSHLDYEEEETLRQQQTTYSGSLDLSNTKLTLRNEVSDLVLPNRFINTNEKHIEVYKWDQQQQYLEGVCIIHSVKPYEEKSHSF